MKQQDKAEQGLSGHVIYDKVCLDSPPGVRLVKFIRNIEIGVKKE